MGDFDGLLLAGEKIEWQGGPQQGVLFTAQDVFLVPFSLLWCGFAIFWEFGAAKSDGNTFFTLWGIPFVCIGLYFVVGRFVFDAWLRARMVYAVTNMRALIQRVGPFGKFTALNLAQISEMDLAESGNGRGTIRLGPALSFFGSRGFSAWSPSQSPVPQFLGIENARDVFNRIQKRRATPA